jgi:pimeloyl-ACP methyl ester carboxylesterase
MPGHIACYEAGSLTSPWSKLMNCRLRPILALFVIPFAACADGGGQNGPDADPGAVASCADVMQAAPLAPADYPFTDALPTATQNTWNGQSIPQAGDAAYPGGKYRTLTPDSRGDTHPGCSTAGLPYDPATIPGYACAAKEYPFPAGITEDTSKAIYLLIHGNSDSPAGWEEYLHDDPDSLEFPADNAMRQQLATRLPALGIRTIAIDMRVALVDDPVEDLERQNAARNLDHGWSVPLTQELLRRVIEAHPDRKVSLVGFSLGATVVRDAIRRLFVEWDEGRWQYNVFEHLEDVILASGAHHGVSSFGLCGANTTMRGTVTCEMGQRNQYSQTAFHRPLNGPAMTGPGSPFGGWFETPCADGDYAFGKRGVCGGNVVTYTTIAMSDLPDGTQQDLFVSEHASRLYPEECATNVVTGLQDFDTSGYFLNGLFRNHYGAVRSERGIAAILQAAQD